jgi:hypothetical protein
MVLGLLVGLGLGKVLGRGGGVLEGRICVPVREMCKCIDEQGYKKPCLAHEKLVVLLKWQVIMWENFC